jgi:hypothetical protein
MVSANFLQDITDVMFMNQMRVNALSFVSLVDPSSRKTTIVTFFYRVFLAIKYASLAMSQTNEKLGKEESGGSIILTASG